MTGNEVCLKLILSIFKSCCCADDFYLTVREMEIRVVIFVPAP
jgi:hypothetical protein